ncbi:MAG: phage integrase SAM-like domain-containing protein [Negativicoccus succinicivorans]|uniref:tyrosine-type recombinase/integrase n=1 Tax=Negativicoccus succinicivorans TaxID=620903 RepID=UPI0029152434|nr:phage integrase SAM-like domain-containing protein [Negativicoccus succinicivorans]MDU4557975.1 phage integrase SAM-like domain-containing protein [Negativicoccus succinicivorans]MDU4575886.1 phage integrase SAM-like domain-containing protein [Negativicoccus succinicivorans]
MWIEEQILQDGTATYRYCERYVDPNTGKRRKISVTLPTCSRPAIKHATAMLAAKIKAKLSDSSYTRVTFEQAAREYEKYRAPALKISTRRNINGIINRLIRMLPPDVLVSEIKLPMIQQGINDLQERGLKRAYIAKHADTFRSIIRFARKMGYVKDIAYLEDIEVQRQPSTLEDAAKHKYKFLDADQLKAVLDELKSMHYRMGMAIEFMSLTGLRFGELAALREQDYDREAAKININGTILPFYRTGTPNNEARRKQARLTEM